MAVLTAIRKYVVREVLKDSPSGVLRTLPNKDLVELNVQVIAQRLMQEGIDPTKLKNANQVENAIKMIESRANVQTGFTTKKSADVFDLEGKKINPDKGIMGGKQFDDLPPGDDDLPPPGSRGGDDDIAAPVQSAEETMKNMIEAENKKNISKMRNRKMVKDAIDNASPGFVKGDRKYNAQLVAEDLADKKFGKEFYDLDQRQQMDLYDEALEGLSEQTRGIPDPEDFAQGGRAGFKTGLGPKFLNFLKGLKKEKPFSVKEFIDKRKFIKADEIENKIQMMKNKKVLEEARKEFKKNPPFKFPEPGDKKYDEGLAKIQRALIEDRKLNADGGRIGYKLGSFKTILNFLNENNPVQAYQKYLKSVKTRAQENPKALVPELAAITSGGIFVNRRMQDILKNMKEKDMENNLENFREELNKDPFYQKYPELKDKTIEAYTEKMFGEKRADGGRAGFANGSGGLLDILNIQAEGSKTGKQQIKGAPEGFTADSETYNFILNADIPINEKINLLTKYGRDKGRTRIEKDGQELFLGEGGSKTREIGLDFNPDAEKGFSGNIMYNPDSNNVKGGITYKFADGGRIGFKDGMTRRTFLKILGGAMSIPIIGKFLAPMKVGKKITKVPMIKTDDVAGKPEWFDSLVNKVILEGDDVTKKFATGERQSIHQKTLDDGSVVRVTEDVDDGAIRVEYQSEKNVFSDDVQLQYKKPLPDEGDPNPAAEFTTAESGPVGRSYGPDDFEIEIDEVGGTSIKDLDSDVSKLKEYATGKKPTMKEFIQNKKRQDKAKAISEDMEAQSDAVIARQGEALDYDDYASGGIARMLGE